MHRSRRRGNRVKPLLDINCDYLTGGIYPDILYVTMRNGHIVRYVIAEPMKVVIRAGDGGWEQTGNEVVGYKRKTAEASDQLAPAETLEKV